MPPPTTSTSNVVAPSAAESRGRMRGYLIVGEQPRKLQMASNNSAVRDYWNQHIHDLEITRIRSGSPGFFADLDQYHFEKLHHLPRLVDFDGYRGTDACSKSAAAPGRTSCGSPKAAPIVTGVDLSSSAIALAKQNFAQQGLTADLREADGEQLPFADDDVRLRLSPTASCSTPATIAALVDECRRVLKPGGTAVFQVYNRISWLNALSKVMKVPLEHEDAPVLMKYSAGEFRGSAHRVSRRADRRGALSGEVAAARRLEGHAVQHVLRRHVQRAAARLGAPLRLAPAGVLPQMRFVKAHAFGNDFLLVENSAAPCGSDRPGAGARACATATAASAPTG